MFKLSNDVVGAVTGKFAQHSQRWVGEKSATWYFGPPNSMIINASEKVGAQFSLSDLSHSAPKQYMFLHIHRLTSNFTVVTSSAVRLGAVLPLLTSSNSRYILIKSLWQDVNYQTHSPMSK
jgi:hypothetical protein